MRKYSIICMLLALGCSVAVQAQRWTATKNLVGFWVDGAYSTMLDDMKQTKSAPGAGGSIGFLYEFQHNAFIVNAGVGFEYNYNAAKVSNASSVIPNMKDSEGDLCDLHYEFSNRQDKAHGGNLQVPVLLGGQWKTFYFLMGAKFSMNLFANTKVDAQLSTYGDYEKFADPFQNMPNHYYFENEPQSSKDVILFKPQVYGSVELGIRLGERQKPRSAGFDLFYKGKIQQRLGLFVDYGILNQHNPKTRELIEMPQNETGNIGDMQMTGLQLNHIYNTNIANSCRLNQLRVGIKYTLLFNLPSEAPCIRCKD